MKEHLKHFVIFIPLLRLVGVLYGIKMFMPDSLCLLQSTATIEVNDNGFIPTSLTVRKCTKVTFKNTGTTDHQPVSHPHPTHDAYQEFNSPQPIASNSSWSFIFSKSGAWKFHDELTPEHRGTITVQ